jgi:hypothetical protein
MTKTKNGRGKAIASDRRSQIIDGCTVPAFASFAKLEAVFSRTNEDGNRGTRYLLR